MIQTIEDCECSLCERIGDSAVLNDGNEWLMVCAECLKAAMDALGEAGDGPGVWGDGKGRDRLLRHCLS